MLAFGTTVAPYNPFWKLKLLLTASTLQNRATIDAVSKTATLSGRAEPLRTRSNPPRLFAKPRICGKGTVVQTTVERMGITSNLLYSPTPFPVTPAPVPSPALSTVIVCSTSWVNAKTMRCGAQ